jgi:hypothetical protein
MGTLRLIQGGPTGGGGDGGEGPDEQLPAASMSALALAADADTEEKTLVAPSVSAIDLRLLGRRPRPPVESVKVPMPAAAPSRSSRAGTPPIASPEQPEQIDAHDASVDIDADTAFFDDGADVAGAPAEPFAHMPSDSGIGALDGDADETAGLDTAPAARTRSGAVDAAASAPPRFDPTDPIAPRMYRRAQSPHPLPLAAPPSPAPMSEDVSIDPAAYAAVSYQPAAPRTGSYPYASPVTGPFTATISALAPALPPPLSIAARSTTHLVCALLAAVAVGLVLGWLLFA